MKQVAESLRNLLTSLVTTMGYEFVGCELNRQGKGSLLCIYIDNEKGITADDCSKVSRQVSAMLDVEDPIVGSYTLEVSSPGIERPLFEIEHFEKYLGRWAKIRLKIPFDNRRHLTGVLLRVEESKIYVLLNEEEIAVPFADIEKAKLINVG